MSYHNGRKFSTLDYDHDDNGKNCAVIYHGAWWYNNCHHSNLNGNYLGGSTHGLGLNWYTFKGLTESLKSTEMKFRAKF